MDHDNPWVMGRFTRFTEPGDHVGNRNHILRPNDPDSLDFVVGLAKAGGVGKGDGDAVKREGHLDMITRRSGNIGDNCSLLSRYRVDKAGLPDVWRARYHD